MPPRVVARELVGHAAAARAALQRPHQGLGSAASMAAAGTPRDAEPLGHDGQVLVLAEGVEAHPQAKAFGQRNLLFHHLARMHFAIVGVGVGAVFRHVLGQQVAPVAGGVDQHVGRGCGHRAVQNGLERLVARLAIFKAQVIAEDDELLGPVGDHVDDVGQVRQVGLVHLDQAQALRRVGIQAGLDERGLARAARARQQHVVGGLALHKLLGVALDLFLLAIDLLQVSQLHGATWRTGSSVPWPLLRLR
jgi:hypothetical protein